MHYQENVQLSSDLLLSQRVGPGDETRVTVPVFYMYTSHCQESHRYTASLISRPFEERKPGTHCVHMHWVLHVSQPHFHSELFKGARVVLVIWTVNG